MRKELELALAAAQTLSPQNLPQFLGALEEVRATALARLVSPASAPVADVLLDVGEAAKRLGMSRDYVYRNHHRYPFTHREGRSLKFSSQGIDRYLRR